MDRVVIGVDPHKRSVTFEARDTREVLRVVGTLPTTKDGYRALRRVAAAVAAVHLACGGADRGTSELRQLRGPSKDSGCERNRAGSFGRRRTMYRRLFILAVVTAAAVTACGDSPDTASAQDQTATSGSGTVAVHIEEIDGVFVEGFEVGLRFETPEGEIIGSTLWSGFVESQGDASLDAYYDSVLEQDVPAGTVVVLASANVGIGPPPDVPDLDGDLRCRLEVEVPDAGRVDVEVTFDDPDDCLRLR